MTTRINELEDQAKAQQDVLDADRVVITLPIYLQTIADELQVQGYAKTYFIADRAYEVVGLSEVHDTAQTSADGASLMVSKVSSTTAPDAAITHLQTDTAFSGTGAVYKGFNLKAAANTVQNATMTNQVSSRLLAAGDRLVWGANGTVASTFLALTTILKKV